VRVAGGCGGLARCDRQNVRHPPPPRDVPEMKETICAGEQGHGGHMVGRERRCTTHANEAIPDGSGGIRRDPTAVY